jgi:Glycogen recognition site of AMP-activated protein kinase
MNAAKTTKPTMSCAHSNGKPGVPALMTKINVRFAPLLSLELQIKPMKPAVIQNKPGVLEAAPPWNRMPFADLMLHPEKLETVLKTAADSWAELSSTEFYLEAPSAKSVKLAADFTDWEKFPLDMIKSENGVWFIFVPLSPGSHPHRFIVDGKWCYDPRLVQHAANPSGADNAVVEVT